MRTSLQRLLNLSLRLAGVAVLVSCAAQGNGVSPVPAPHSVSSPQAASGTSDTGGGDWFVQPLPILKIQFPPDDGIVEGVRYKRFDLPRCTEIDSQGTNSENAPIAFFPGAGFSAVKVQTWVNEIHCSYGIVETDPDQALQLLVNNEETNRLNSKLYGGSALIGNFLVSVENDGRLALFSNHIVRPDPIEKHFYSFRPTHPDRVDSIYVPVDIEPSDRTYFGHNEMGNWRLLLPTAFTEAEVPLRAYAKKLTPLSQLNPIELDLLNEVALPSGFPSGGVAPWTTVAQIFSSLQRTSTNTDLLFKFYKKYDLHLSLDRPDTYGELKVLSEKFNFEFSPTVGLLEIQHAGFHASTTRMKFTLPLLNPTWRVVADLIHEMTHSLQTHSSNDSQEQRFKNELEAHLNERAYLDWIAAKYPVIRDAIATRRQIVAAGVPNVAFVESAADVPPSLSLCDNILKSYHLTRDKISPDLLKRSGCKTPAK